MIILTCCLNFSTHSDDNDGSFVISEPNKSVEEEEDEEPRYVLKFKKHNSDPPGPESREWSSSSSENESIRRLNISNNYLKR